jgi:hypothetical protein
MWWDRWWVEKIEEKRMWKLEALGCDGLGREVREEVVPSFLLSSREASEE